MSKSPSTDDVLKWLRKWDVPVRGTLLAGLMRSDRKWCEQHTRDEIAERFGVPAEKLTHDVIKQADVIPRRAKMGKRLPTITNGSWHESVDWDEQNSVIAEKVGVERERVRQVRRILGKPNAVRHNKKRESVELWMRDNWEWCENRTATDVAKKLGVKPNAAYVAAKKIGLSFRKKPLCCEHWNWDLPNRDLNRIWNRANTGTDRQRYGWPARWNLRHKGVDRDPEYRKALRQEELKAIKQNNRKGDG